MVTDKRVENMIRNTDAAHEEHMLLKKDVIRQVKKGKLASGPQWCALSVIMSWSKR